VRRVVVVAVVVRRRDSRLAEATAEADVEVEIEAIAGTSAARRDQQRLGTLEPWKQSVCLALAGDQTLRWACQSSRARHARLRPLLPLSSNVGLSMQHKS
jgi:hypothetical protein